MLRSACLSLSLVLLSAVASFAESPLDGLVRSLAEAKAPEFQARVLRGMNAALKGKRNLPAPAGWEALAPKLRDSSSAEVRQQAQLLAAVFGGGAALEDLRQTLASRRAAPEVRQAALESLAAARDPATLPLLLGLLGEPGPLRRAALRGLAAYDAPPVAPRILAAYPSLGGEEKRDALATLVRRPEGAHLLLAAIDARQVPASDLTAPFARQLQGLHESQIDAWLQNNWGAVRTSSTQRQAEIAQFKTFLLPAKIDVADANHGRTLFAQRCSICHTLFGAGAKIGPELPGAFEDVDYLLQNIIDPNAIIGKDYQQTVVQTKTGDTVVGIVGGEDASSLTLKTLSGPVILPRVEVAQVSVLETSLMPEGLLTSMSQGEALDLFAYLRRHGQAPALLEAGNVNDFVNDPGWERWLRSSPTAWKVEGGELLGTGSADRAETVTSDFIAGDFVLEVDLQVRGAGAEAEMEVRGDHDGGFTGLRLRLTAGSAVLLHLPTNNGPAHELLRENGLALGEWVHCRLEAVGDAVRLQIGERSHLKVEGAFPERRTNFGFGIRGAQGELRLRKLSLQLVAPKQG